MEPKIVLLDRDYSPESLRELDSLDLRNIDGSVWEVVLSTCKANNLRLYHVLLPSLEGIERLHDTSRLSIEWANKISELIPVFRMSWLEYLFISDFPRLTNVDGIGALQNLTELHLSGNRGSLHPPLRMKSAQPIAELTNLKTLTLANMRLEDDDITFIASLPKLKDLSPSNRFDRKQFAFLAKRLNAQLESPITASRPLNITCEKCGRHVVLFTGKRMPILCGNCDRGKAEKLTLQFQSLIAAS